MPCVGERVEGIWGGGNWRKDRVMDRIYVKNVLHKLVGGYATISIGFGGYVMELDPKNNGMSLVDVKNNAHTCKQYWLLQIPVSSSEEC